DCRLAERGYGDYPGLYHMVEIQSKDWGVLPPVPAGKDAVNLKPEAVDELKARGYIVGQLPRTIFYEKNIKETDWSATEAVAGVDGRKRRWVYLHYFKGGQHLQLAGSHVRRAAAGHWGRAPLPGHTG